MSKSDNVKISEDEIKVTEQLLEDSRQSPHEIAKKLGLSRQTVWRIIKKLEKNNILWGYTAIVDETIFGYNSYFALLRSKGPFNDVLESSIKRLKGKNAEKMNIRLLGCFYVNGPYDWIILFSAADIRDAKKFCGYMQKEYGGILDRIELLENVFSLLKLGKVNPDIERYKEIAAF